MNPPGKPVTLLIAALGGEGGGVLTNWIVGAAESLGLPVQSTSIPRRPAHGATTYYVEILPAPWSELGGRQPILSLVPGVGDIDVLVASELMEAGRAVAAGFVTPGQTLTIASTSRFYVMNEKIAMGDGRYDSGRLVQAIEQHSQARILFDMEEIARRNRRHHQRRDARRHRGLRPPADAPEAFESAIRTERQGGRGEPARFRAGLDAARQSYLTLQADAARTEINRPKTRTRRRDLAGRSRARHRRPHVGRGARHRHGRRAAAGGLSEHYLMRSSTSIASPRSPRRRARRRQRKTSARDRPHLAVRMSYEDVIRVAQAKIDPARFARIAAEVGAKPDEPLNITEFLKPGIDELCSILPPRAGQGHPWCGRAPPLAGAAGIGACRSTPRRSRASCASAARQACGHGARAAIDSRRSGARSRPGWR